MKFAIQLSVLAAFVLFCCWLQSGLFLHSRTLSRHIQVLKIHPQLTRVINPQKGVRVHIRQHSQRLLLIRQQRSTENVTQPFVNRASALDPSWSLQRSPDPLSGTQGACCPLPKNSARAVSPLDLITSSPLFSGTPVSFF